MRIAMALGTEALGSSVPPQFLVEQAQTAEEDGFPSAWCVHFSRGIDALTTLAVAGTTTSRIELGVGIVPTYPRHPLALAQQAATVQAFIGGRLTLGVGVSHQAVIEGMHGIPYTRPAAHMREYLSVLGPLLSDGRVSFQGDFFNVEAEFNVPGTRPVPIVVGALAENMVRVAGELADGVITWMAGLSSLERDILPVLRQAAQKAGRPSPRLIAGLPVAVCDDPAAGREAANTLFARYGTLPVYQRQFAREGITGPGELASVGDEAAVEEALRRYAAIGVTEFWPAVLPVGDDPSASTARTYALLRSLAQKEL